MDKKHCYYSHYFICSNKKTAKWFCLAN